MKKNFTFSVLEIVVLVVDIVLFVGSLATFVFQIYDGAIVAFVAFAVCSMLLLVLVFDSAQAQLCENIKDEEAEADYINLKIDDAMLEANQEKSRLESEVLRLKEEKEELNKNLEDQKRAMESMAKQLEFKNNEFNELTGLAEDQKESLLAKSLIPNPDNENSEMINIINLAKESASEISNYAKKAGIDIVFNSKDDSLMVKADKQRLRIMFKNIMDNSVKYMGKSGKLIITISHVEDIIFIVLKDNGNGLASEEVSHIFELNYQGSNRISGNGLGLTQAKAIVDYYGGNIYAKSGTNSGMAIYIQLPAI